MKTYFAAAVLALFCTTLFAGSPSKAAGDGFEKLKSLVGTWKGKSPEGEVTLTYKLVSGGSTVMEVNDSEKHKDGMVSMYTLDGGKVMMTHYCSMGNQPRMKCTGLSKDEKSLAFSFVDGGNMDAKKDAHMHALTITFKDKDTMVQNWTMRSPGKDEMHVEMEMTRVN